MVSSGLEIKYGVQVDWRIPQPNHLLHQISASPSKVSSISVSLKSHDNRKTKTWRVGRSLGYQVVFMPKMQKGENPKAAQGKFQMCRSSVRLLWLSRTSKGENSWPEPSITKENSWSCMVCPERTNGCGDLLSTIHSFGS